MIKNYVAVMKKYVDFTGRARRKEYWLFVLANMIIAAILSIPITASNDVGMVFSVITGLYSLVIILPVLAVLVRRMHDLGKSGAYIFISLIPIIGGIWLFVLLVSDSKPGENDYGLNPKEVIDTAA